MAPQTEVIQQDETQAKPAKQKTRLFQSKSPHRLVDDFVLPAIPQGRGQPTKLADQFNLPEPKPATPTPTTQPALPIAAPPTPQATPTSPATPGDDITRLEQEIKKPEYRYVPEERYTTGAEHVPNKPDDYVKPTDAELQGKKEQPGIFDRIGELFGGRAHPPTPQKPKAEKQAPQNLKDTWNQIGLGLAQEKMHLEGQQRDLEKENKGLELHRPYGDADIPRLKSRLQSLHTPIEMKLRDLDWRLTKANALPWEEPPTPKEFEELKGLQTEYNDTLKTLNSKISAQQARVKKFNEQVKEFHTRAQAHEAEVKEHAKKFEVFRKSPVPTGEEVLTPDQPSAFGEMRKVSVPPASDLHEGPFVATGTLDAQPNVTQWKAIGKNIMAHVGGLTEEEQARLEKGSIDPETSELLAQQSKQEPPPSVSMSRFPALPGTTGHFPTTESRAQDIRDAGTIARAAVGTLNAWYSPAMLALGGLGRVGAKAVGAVTGMKAEAQAIHAEAMAASEEAYKFSQTGQLNEARASADKANQLFEAAYKKAGQWGKVKALVSGVSAMNAAIGSWFSASYVAQAQKDWQEGKQTEAAADVLGALGSFIFASAGGIGAARTLPATLKEKAPPKIEIEAPVIGAAKPEATQPKPEVPPPPAEPLEAKPITTVETATPETEAAGGVPQPKRPSAEPTPPAATGAPPTPIAEGKPAVEPQVPSVGKPEPSAGLQQHRAGLIDKVNQRDWWHVPPQDKEAYQKRGQFFSSSFKEAEFYGRPQDRPSKVKVENPLMGDEAAITKELGLPEPPEDISVENRFELDANMKREAEKRGYDSIALMTPKAWATFQETGKVPSSIELNVFKAPSAGLQRPEAPTKPTGPDYSPENIARVRGELEKDAPQIEWTDSQIKREIASRAGVKPEPSTREPVAEPVKAPGKVEVPSQAPPPTYKEGDEVKVWNRKTGEWEDATVDFNPPGAQDEINVTMKRALRAGGVPILEARTVKPEDIVKHGETPPAGGPTPKPEFNFEQQRFLKSKGYTPEQAVALSKAEQDKLSSEFIEWRKEFPNLPAKSVEKFNTAWEGSNIPAMGDMLHPSNKTMRAEFEKRSGVKLPSTVGGTKEAVKQYFLTRGTKPAEPTKPRPLFTKPPAKPEVSAGLQQPEKPGEPVAAGKEEFRPGSITVPFGRYSDKKGTQRISVTGEHLGGLFIHPRLEEHGKPTNEWDVTHSESGLRIVGPFDNLFSAREAAEKLSPITDWMVSGDDISKVKGLGAKVRAIESEVKGKSQSLIAAEKSLAESEQGKGLPEGAHEWEAVENAWTKGLTLQGRRDLLATLGWDAKDQDAVAKTAWRHLSDPYKAEIAKALDKASALEDTETTETEAEHEPTTEPVTTPGRVPPAAPSVGGPTEEPLEGVRPGTVQPTEEVGQAGGALPETGGTRQPRGPSAPAGGRKPAGGRGRGQEAVDISGKRPERITVLKNGDIHIEDPDLISGKGEPLLKQLENNIEAIKTLKAIEEEGRDRATPEEQAKLVRFVGWGGLRDTAFKETDKGRKRELQLQLTGGYNDEGSYVKGVLSREDIESAREASLNQNMTSPEVILGMYDVLREMGFTGGKVLEPAMAIGHFFGLMPLDMAQGSVRIGYEIENISGKIAKLLYPGADIHITGFEQTSRKGTSPLPKNFVDLLITNVPFGEKGLGPNDPEYNGKRLNLHNYFLVKGLDHVRPGGIMMAITSKYTLDSVDSKARNLMAERADLLAAIRLPQDAFEENANTTVTTDILIFQRREAGAPYAGEDFIGAVEQPDPQGGEPLKYNQYFVKHPEMMIGRMERTGRGRGFDVIGLVRPEGLTDLRQAIRSAFGIEAQPVIEAAETGVSKFGAEMPKPGVVAGVPSALNRIRGAFKPVTPNTGASPITEAGAIMAQDSKPDVIEKPPTALFQGKAPEIETNWQIVVSGNSVYQKVQDDDGMYRVKKLDYNSDQVKKVRGLFDLRAQTRDLLTAELTNRPDEELDELRKGLNEAYDKFVSRFGKINEPRNFRLVEEDPDSAVIAALERSNKISKGKYEWVKVDMFSKKTVQPPKGPGDLKTAKDAMLYSLNQHAAVKLDEMARWMGKSEQEVVDELGPLLFHDPQGGYVESEEYLSGNVRQKLSAAQTALKYDPKYQRNVEALEKVIPADKPPHRIPVRLGVPWVPAEDVTDFVASHLFPDFPMYTRESIRVRKMDPPLGKWIVSAPAQIANSAQSKSKWGTKKRSAISLLESALNSQYVEVRETDKDTGKSYVDQDATVAAQGKLEDLHKEFQKWLWSNPDRTTRLARVYNDTFNNEVERQWDGSHLEFPGMNKLAFVPHRGQRDGIWRALRSPRNTLMAHEAGLGKTLEIVAVAMEARRIGRARKPFVTVYNSTLEQYRELIPKLYPGARFLILDKDNMQGDKRRQTLSRAATGDWDMVVLAHSTFGKIPMSPEAIHDFFDEQLAEIEQQLQQAYESGERKNSPTVRELEAAKKKLEERLKKLLAAHHKDTGLSWEELGCDLLIVDESQEFIKDQVITGLRRVAGLPTGASQRGFDMRMKTRHVSQKNGGRGVVFATGTPMRNTLAEAFVLQRYLDPQGLRDAGTERFDDWHPVFAIPENAYEFKATGQLKNTLRMRDFHNLHELQKMIRSFTDVRKIKDYLDEIKGLPTLKTSEVHSPMTPEQEAYTASLKERMENMKDVDPHVDNALKVFHDGQIANITMKFHYPEIDVEPEGKMSKVARTVAAAYKQGRANKLTQAVFLNFGTPDGAKERGTLDAYGELKDLMVKNGVPADQITFIHEAKNREQAFQIFEGMNDGEIAVLVTTAFKGGVGVNMQQRLWQMHMVDIPFRPDQFEQALKRMVRQGNMNPEVILNVYITEGTKKTPSFDAVMYQKLQQKKKAIDDLFDGKIDMEADSMEDIGSENYGQWMAEATGDPLMMERHKMQGDLARLESLHRSYLDNREMLRIRESQIEESLSTAGNLLKRLEDSAAILAKNKPKEFEMKVGNQGLTERKAAGLALRDETLKVYGKEASQPNWNLVKVGEYAGAPILSSHFAAYDKKVTFGSSYGFEIATPEHLSFGAGVHAANFLEHPDIIKKEGEDLLTPEELDNQAVGLIRSMEMASDGIPKRVADTKRVVSDLESELPRVRNEAAKPFEQEEERVGLLDRIREIEKQISEKDKQQPPVIIEEVPEEPSEDDEDEIDTDTGESKFAAQAQPIPGQVMGAAQPKAGILRTSDITKRLRDFLEVPLGYGRFKQRAWGIFKVGPKAIRLKSSANYSVLLHELAHALNQHLWGDITKLEHKQFAKYRKELMSFVQHFPPSERKLTEGFAEYTRNWLENPSNARKQAPKFTAFFEGLLNQPGNDELRDVLEETQRMAGAYAAQTDLEKLQGAIHFDEKPHKTWADRWHSISRQYYDSLDPIRLQQNLVFGTKWTDQVNPDVNAFVMASRLNSHVRGEFTAYLMEGVRDFDTRKLIPGTKGPMAIYDDLFKGVPDVTKEYQDWSAYWIARSAIERLTNNPKSVQALEKAQFENVRDTLEKQHPKFRPAAEQFDFNNQQMMLQLRKAGVAKPEVIDKIMAMHQNHVPLYRHIDPEGLGKAGAGLGKGVAKVGLPFKRAHGGKQDYLDPVVSHELNAAGIIATIERARVNTALYKWLKVPASANVIEEVSAKSHPVSFRLQEIKNALEGAGFDPDSGDLDAVAQVWRPTPERDPKFATHYDPKDDKMHIMEIKDPEMAKAIGSLTPQQVNPMVAASAILSRTLHLGVAAAPTFMLRHFERHFSYASAISRYLDPFHYAWGIAKGVGEIFTGGEIKDAMIRQGLSFASIPGLGRRRIEDFLRSQVNKKKRGLPYTLVTRHPLEAMSKMTGLMDIATRSPEFEAAYKDALSRGATPAEAEIFAGYQAAEVSVNFSKIGTALRELSIMAPFARAHLVGQVKLVGSFMRNPGRTARNFLLTITSLSLLLYLLNRKDDEYHRLPAWRKVFWWNIPVGDAIEKTTGFHFLILPKPWIAGWAFGSVPEAILERIDRDDPRAIDHVLEGLWQTQVPDFLPLPLQIVKHQLENKDKFNRPIVPTSLEGKVKPEYQYGPYTPALARWLGHGVGISPARIASAYQDMTGNLGQDLSRVSDMIDALSSGKSEPATGLVGIPVLGGFGTAAPGFNAQPIEDFYDVKKKLDQQYATGRLPFAGIKDISKMTREQAEKAGKAYRGEPGLRQEGVLAVQQTQVREIFTYTAQAIAGFRDEATRARMSDTMTSEAKQEAIKASANKAIVLAERALAFYDKTQKTKPVPLFKRAVPETQPNQ